MARLSQKQLEERAAERRLKKAQENNQTESENKNSERELGDKSSHLEITPKMIGDILNEGAEQLYKYKLPQNYTLDKNGTGLPFVNANDYPKLNVKGKFSVERQNKGANLYVLKEIDFLLDKINEGKNKNATLNFLIWVGLQTLKGMNETIEIKVHDSTYADGEVIKSFMQDDSDLS